LITAITAIVAMTRFGLQKMASFETTSDFYMILMAHQQAALITMDPEMMESGSQAMIRLRK